MRVLSLSQIETHLTRASSLLCEAAALNALTTHTLLFAGKVQHL
jgi:hypothetical protein